MKKVLLVTYHYPPSPLVGAFRPAKFARYLPKFGWESTVLTVRTGNANQSIAEDSPAQICRIREWPHPLKYYDRFIEWRLGRPGHNPQLAAKMSAPLAVVMDPPRTGFIGLKRWLLAFLWLPDREVGWLVPAIARGLRLIRQERIEHLITTAPPFTAHLVGLTLKRLTGIRWIADFRDPWSLRQKFPVHRNQVTDFVEGRLIRRVLEKGDLIISVTRMMTEQLKADYPDLNADKFITLSNGFDAAEFIGLSSSPLLPEPVVFLHPGTFYQMRPPFPFLRALKSLIDDKILKPSEVRVKFIGHVEMAEGRSVPEVVRELGLDKIVTISPRVPRREALQETLNAHITLVLTGYLSEILPFKIFGALASGVTILCIGSGGEVAELLAQTGRGVSVNHLSQTEIRQGILECIRRSRDNRCQRVSKPWEDPAIQAYNFRNLTATLARLLETLK